MLRYHIGAHTYVPVPACITYNIIAFKYSLSLSQLFVCVWYLIFCTVYTVYSVATVMAGWVYK